jgi:alkylation response protein AidB-like acyl-CoA dehydrogenase
MALVLDEEQTLLKQTARRLLQDKSPVKALRELRDSRDETGFSRELWKEMVEMGWAGIVIPEQYGGFDYGYVGLGLVLEECGRMLVASPLVSTVLLGATAVTLAGSEAQKEDILPAVASGKLLLALALEEGPHHAPTRVATRVVKTGDGFTLSGKKAFVIDGHVADKFVVVARTSGQPGDTDGISLFLVDAKTPGVTATRIIMVDSRNAAKVSFDNVRIPASALLGQIGKGYSVLEKVLDIGRIGLAAEMLGSMQEAFERTINYLKERSQFGVLIGTFQALQHRTTIMFTEIELCKSVVLKALQTIDAGDEELLPRIAALAKAKACETVKLVTSEAIQMFGGIGMTDEEEIGFFIKRARVAQQAFGDYSYQLNRFAALNGY